MTNDEKLQAAIEAEKKGDYNQAELLAKEVLSHLNTATEHAKANNVLGLIYNHRADYITALENYNSALQIFEILNDARNAATVRGNIGNVYRLLADYPLSLEYLIQALAAHEEHGNESGAANIRHSIGSVHLSISDYPRALENYNYALEEYEKLGMKREAATARGHIGAIYMSLLDFPRAVEYFTRALSELEGLGYKASAAIFRGNIGVVYKNLQDYGRALQFSTQALAEHEKLGMKREAAAIRGNIGSIYGDLMDYSLALEYFTQTLAEYEELGIKVGAAFIRGNIGMLYANEKYNGNDVTKAESYLLEAVAQFEELGDKHMQYEAHKSISRLYEQQMRWSEAVDHYKRYHELYVEVQSEEATKQAQLMEHRRKIEESEKDRQLKIARHEVTISLLHKTLPPSIAQRLMDGEKNIADKFESVSILFADIVGFTPLSARTEPKHMVELLNNLFTRFDKLTVEYKVERIKTIGDAYMVVAGAPERCEDHAERIAHFALAMLEETKKFGAEIGENIRMRLGINSGEAVGAVVGETKFSYDLWSDAVNTASRMESHGEAGRIHVSEEFVDHIKRTHPEFIERQGKGLEAIVLQQAQHGVASIQFIERGEIEIKGKGKMRTYFLERG